MPTPLEARWLVVNGYLIGSARVRLLDDADLYNSSPRRGDNLRLPLSRGRRRYPRRPDERVCQLAIQVNGYLDDDGAETVGDAMIAASTTMLDITDEDGPLGVGLDEVTIEWHHDGITDTTTGGQVHGIFGVQWPAPAVGDAVLEVVLPPTWDVGS